MVLHQVKEETEQIALKLGKEEILAVGLFGSLVQGGFDEKSDIDIFVITTRELSLKEQDELYYIFSELIAKFERDVTVLVYDISSLKKVPSWQTLNLVKDGCFVYERGGVKGNLSPDS